MPKDIASSQPRLVYLLSAFLPIVNKSVVFIVTKFSVNNNYNKSSYFRVKLKRIKFWL